MHKEPAERIAVISDVHGNSLALRAVIDDIEDLGIGRILNLGDSVYGPLDPAGTADLLISRKVTGVRGNEDRILLDDRGETGTGGPSMERDAANPSLAFTMERLTGTQLVWISLLPAELRIEPDLFLCHGSPGDDTAYLLWTVDNTGARRSSGEEILDRLSGIGAPVILCGHDHVPYDLRLPDCRLILDPGSVGLPAYRDGHPYPHAMQSGTPHARYAILHHADESWEVEHRSVAYDWDSASRMAAENGRPDWAEWLLTGRADYSIL